MWNINMISGQGIWISERIKPYRNTIFGMWAISLITLLLTLYISYFITHQNPCPAVLIPFCITLISFPLWFLTWEKCYRYFAKKMLQSRFKNPKIAILSVNGMDETETKELLRSTVYLPKDWDERLRSSDIHAKITTGLSIDRDYSMLLNPFGELYLEEDTANLKTFQKIKEYIKTGGVFVNTGGLAFYYMWNPRTKIEGLPGPMLEFYTGQALTKPTDNASTYESSITLSPAIDPENSYLTDTWLYKNFGVRTSFWGEFSLEAKNTTHFDNFIIENTKIPEFRSALRCETAEAQLIPIIRSEYKYKHTGKIHECYPIAAVKYGRGYLILVGMRLKEEKDLTLVIIAIKKIIERLREKGTLELE